MHLGAKLGELEGKLGYREVVFKLSWAILFGHVVAFASRNAFPQQDQDFKWVSASYVGSIWSRSKYGYLMAALVPSWGQFSRFWGCVEGYMGSFWTCC